MFLGVVAQTHKQRLRQSTLVILPSFSWQNSSDDTRSKQEESLKITMQMNTLNGEMLRNIEVVYFGIQKLPKTGPSLEILFYYIYLPKQRYST